jgi:very-short-patch-repair endonuclease
LKILDLYGRPKNIGAKKYKIDWYGKSPSKGQFSTKQFLKQFWYNDIVFEEFVIPSSRLRVDFLNYTKKIAVEFDGKQHSEFVEHFHKNRSKFLKSFNRDVQKEEWIKKNNFSLIQIVEDDLKFLSRKYILENFSIDIL